MTNPLENLAAAVAVVLIVIASWTPLINVPPAQATVVTSPELA
jgi:hypothetical protein